MKLGIALSGGGIRGIAHAGVLQALEDNGIKPDIIGGTSCGSMIAVLYAMGYSPYHIHILFKRYRNKIFSFILGIIISNVLFLFINILKIMVLKNLIIGILLLGIGYFISLLFDV